MPLFDTSALVPLFDEAHPNHKKATAAFQAADLVLLHPCVVLELTTVLRRLGKAARLDGNRAAREALVVLLQEPRVRMEGNHDAAVELFLADTRISFTDAIVAVSGSGVDAPVAFDDAISKAAAMPPEKRVKARKAIEARVARK